MNRNKSTVPALTAVTPIFQWQPRQVEKATQEGLSSGGTPVQLSYLLQCALRKQLLHLSSLCQLTFSFTVESFTNVLETVTTWLPRV